MHHLVQKFSSWFEGFGHMHAQPPNLATRAELNPAPPTTTPGRGRAEQTAARWRRAAKRCRRAACDADACVRLWRERVRRRVFAGVWLVGVVRGACVWMSALGARVGGLFVGSRACFVLKAALRLCRGRRSCTSTFLR